MWIKFCDIGTYHVLSIPTFLLFKNGRSWINGGAMERRDERTVLSLSEIWKMF